MAETSRFIATLALVGLFSAIRPFGSLAAQTPAPTAPVQSTGPELIDRVVAVVGTQPILMSEVNERVQQARAQGMRVPEDSAGVLTMQRQFLQSLVEDEVLYQQARKDTSIVITEAEIQTAVDQQFHNVRGQFHSDQELQAALQGAGLGTIEEYRRYLADQSRRTAYAQRFVQKQTQTGKMRAGIVGEPEMRAFFDQGMRSGQLDSLPPTITFRQIVIAPRASDSARATALRLADSLRIVIEHGGDFKELARQFSQDPGSRENGGDLGFFRRGTMVRQFEEVAFNMRTGVVSPVVRTEFGYHLIWVDRVQTGEIKARHILIIPKVSENDQAFAHHLGDSVATLARAGANFDSLARVFSDTGEAHVIGPTNRDSLPAGYAEAMTTVSVNQIVEAPLPQVPAERTKWLVARVTDLQTKRMPSFEDVREQVRLRLVDQKGYRNLIEDLKKKTYVDVRL